MAEEQSNRRLHTRWKLYISCQIDCGDRQISGKIIDACDGGITILFPEAAELIKKEARVHIPMVRQSPDEPPDGITLRVQLVYLLKKSKGHRVGLKIEQIESGEPEWARLCHMLH
jgi:hypothetical protein